MYSFNNYFNTEFLLKNAPLVLSLPDRPPINVKINSIEEKNDKYKILLLKEPTNNEIWYVKDDGSDIWLVKPQTLKGSNRITFAETNIKVGLTRGKYGGNFTNETLHLGSSIKGKTIEKPHIEIQATKLTKKNINTLIKDHEMPEILNIVAASSKVTAVTHTIDKVLKTNNIEYTDLVLAAIQANDKLDNKDKADILEDLIERGYIDHEETWKLPMLERIVAGGYADEVESIARAAGSNGVTAMRRILEEGIAAIKVGEIKGSD